jgi:8-oxo-dGTP pyrophosphatase MutT (NUDIX family)
VADAAYIQYGALPYRLDAQGRPEVLLVTSRRTRRWILPKGWPIKGLNPAKSAAREAFEEAGIVGEVSAQPVGAFRYDKLFERTGLSSPCTVEVFPLKVTRQFEHWPEAGQRQTRWAHAEDLPAMVEDRDLRRFIEAALERLGYGVT